MRSPRNGIAAATSNVAALPLGSRSSTSLSADPFQSVLSLGPRVPVAVMVVAALLALSLHAGAMAGAVQAAFFEAFASWARDVHGAVAGKLAQTYDVDIIKPLEKPEEPPTPPAEEKEPPKAVVKEVSKETPPPQPPAAADAAKVLLAEAAKNEPVDLTGNTFLNGNAETAVGGTTQIGGTGKVATNNPAAVATGVAGGTGTAPAGPRIDRSRAAQILNKSNLERCPFPAEADAEQVDEAAVGIEVKVGPDGRAETVAVTRDPGHGFGREARKCALREKYAPALNAEGVAMPGVYRVNFRFSR